MAEADALLEQGVVEAVAREAMMTATTWDGQERRRTAWLEQQVGRAGEAAWLEGLAARRLSLNHGRPCMGNATPVIADADT